MTSDKDQIFNVYASLNQKQSISLHTESPNFYFPMLLQGNLSVIFNFNSLIYIWCLVMKAVFGYQGCLGAGEMFRVLIFTKLNCAISISIWIIWLSQMHIKKIHYRFFQLPCNELMTSYLKRPSPLMSEEYIKVIKITVTVFALNTFLYLWISNPFVSINELHLKMPWKERLKFLYPKVCRS